ncbi:MAG: ribonuclease [Gaiellales bacterium]|jgi:ribonuclease D|nr:ribonuclease [Gaiellales bacterium]
MVYIVQAGDALDPRCYATVGIEPRTRALLTAVPHGGALLREGTSSRRGRPFWAVTLRAADGPAAGVYAELRLWPESNLDWFLGRLALLCESDPETIAALSPDEQRALLVHNLAERSYAGILETAADGLADVAYLEGIRARAELAGDLPEPPAARRVAPPPDVPGAPLPHPRFALVEDTAALARLCDRLLPATAFAVDIETDCGPLGAPAGWSPADGAVRLLQVAARIGGEIVCGVVDCYRVAPRPLLRMLADGREVIAHNARYEQAWLTFQFGLPAWRSVMDTSCAFRVFERHWSIQDPSYERRDATLATVTRRLLGAPKGDYGPDWWGAERLPPEQLDYAAYDAVVLVELRDRALALAEQFGCTDQVLAASRTACVEAFRHLPQPHSHVLETAYELIDSAVDEAGLARAAAAIRRLPLAAWQRAALRERYALQRRALAA